MKAMVLEASSTIALRQIDMPKVEAGQTLIRVSHSGICGTDRKIYAGEIPVYYPLIMGHEMVGEIVEGQSNDGGREGTKVIVDPSLHCGDCFQCRAGQTHICPEGKVLGRDIDGGFAEYVVAPASQVYSLPPGIDLRDAPLIQVLTTCVHAHRRTPIFPGEVVVVTGLGVTGQLHVQLARARGAGTIVGISRNRWKRELAENLGADITVEPGSAARESILACSDGRGADLVIETTGVASVLADGIDVARIGGRMMMFGIHTATQAKLPFYQLYFKELDLMNPRAAKGEDFPASIDLVRRGAVQLNPLISHVLGLHDLDQALDMLVADKSDRMKIVLAH